MLVNETVILSSQDDTLVLTNMRVKHEIKTKAKTVYKSIPLDQIATCALDTRTHPILLVLAALSAMALLLAPEISQRLAAGILALGLAAAYFVTRNGQIEIFASSGESIAVPTKRLQHDDIKKFLEAVEAQRGKFKLAE